MFGHQFVQVGVFAEPVAGALDVDGAVTVERRLSLRLCRRMGSSEMADDIGRDLGR